ncbi:MAG: DUF6438 domain-containing protein [Gammaproteobacteria bacterium]
MKSEHTTRHTRRRSSRARFLTLAVLTAVVIFVIVEFVPILLRQHSASQQRVAPASATAAMAAASDSLKGFEVVLWRQGCAAGCPDYALHYAGGKLQYTGIRNVIKKGNLSVNFDTYHQQQLLKLVEQAAFFGLGDDYTLQSKGCHPNRSNAAIYVVGITLNGETKKVKVNEGCTNVPSQLSQLSRGIDKLTRSARWTGVIKAPANATQTGGQK